MRVRAWTLAVVAPILAAGFLPGVASQAATPAAGPAAGPASAARAAAADPSFAGGSSASAETRWVRLVTGQRIGVTTLADGRQQVQLAPSARRRAAYMSFRWDGDLYVVPHSATALLGRQYSLADFDVSALARGESHGPLHPPVTRNGPRAPHFQMYTLTVNGINAAGRADAGDMVMVANVDDMRKFVDFTFFYRGQFRLSVPAGHYVLAAFFTTFNPGTGAQRVQLVTLPQLSVTGVRTVTMDARKATTPVSVTVPRKVVTASADLTIDRADPRGDQAEFGFGLSGGSIQLRAQPTRPVTVGALHYYSAWTLFSPARSRDRYVYNLEYPANRAIPARQTHHVQNRRLGLIHAAYYSDVAHRPGVLFWFSYLPWQFVSFGNGYSFNQPLVQQEYYSARPRLSWSTSFFAYLGVKNLVINGSFMSPTRIFTPGQRLTVHYLREPLHPGVEDQLRQFELCPACRTGRYLTLDVYPYADNAGDTAPPDGPGWPGLTEADSYVLSADGVPIASGTDPLGAAVQIPAARTHYQLSYDLIRSAPWFRFSTQTDTVWRFVSAAGSGARLPASWICGERGSRHCLVQPLMMPSYQLPTSLLGREPPGRTHFTLRVGTFHGAPVDPATRARVWVSFDGGADWTAATVRSLGGGRFAVSYTNPQAAPTGTLAALRVSATGPAGSVSQTILQAYQVGR